MHTHYTIYFAGTLESPKSFGRFQYVFGETAKLPVLHTKQIAVVWAEGISPTVFFKSILA